MTAQPIQTILIVGGGTAGWLSAAYLQRALGNTVKVALVESRHIPPIGVGEATVSTLQ
jgi:tryptophan halogenase